MHACTTRGITCTSCCGGQIHDTSSRYQQELHARMHHKGHHLHLVLWWPDSRYQSAIPAGTACTHAPQGASLAPRVVVARFTIPVRDTSRNCMHACTTRGITCPSCCGGQIHDTSP